MASSQIQAAGSRALPTLMNIGRLAFTRVFNSVHYTPSQQQSGADAVNAAVPLAVANAGGFDLPPADGAGAGFTLDHDAAGGPALPRSLQFLVVNGVAVKPERILRDLPWERLLVEGSALDPHHRAAAREQVERLSALQRQGMKIDPQTAVEIFRRFATWTDLINLGDLLSRRPAVPTGAGSSADRDRFGARVDLYCKDVDLLERMRERVDACMRAGDCETAQKLADRALEKSGRLSALLAALRQRLEAAEERSAERLRRCARVAGGFVLVAVGASYAGYAAELPGVPSSLLAATADAATVGSVVCVLATTAQWLATPDFAAHLDRVQRMQLQREITRNHIDTLACEAMMESAAAKAAPAAPAPAVGLRAVAEMAVAVGDAARVATPEGGAAGVAAAAAAEAEFDDDDDDGSFELVAV